MITVECPWCAEPMAVDTAAFAEVECEPCAISVRIAPDPLTAMLDRAA